MVTWSKKTVLAIGIVIAFVVVAAVAGSILGHRHLERFSGGDGAQTAAKRMAATLAAKLKGFTAQEREMFKNLQDNKYTTNQIDDLIKEGVLNSKVVDKFLAALNVV